MSSTVQNVSERRNTTTHPTTPQTSAASQRAAAAPAAPERREVGAVDAPVKDGRGYGLDLDSNGRFDRGRDGVLAFDFDKNGSVSSNEVRDSRAALDAFSGNQDGNGDGNVTSEEAAQSQRLAGLVAKFDANGDGKLNNAELKAADAKVLIGDATKGIDELPVDGRNGRLAQIDPKNFGAQVEVGGEAAEAATADAAKGEQAAQGSPASSGPASPKGPTNMLEGVPAGFLWKPESDSNGNLVVLLPPGMKAKAVNVLSPDGQVLASGADSGVGNGGRQHFRFKAPGGSFPPNCKCQIVLANGQTQEITIPNPAMRNEGAGGGGKK